MRKVAVCVFMCFVWCITVIDCRRDYIPRKTNIAIIVDVGSKYHTYTHSLLGSILDGISLADYRISFYTTSGLSIGLLKFQSRQCILDKFKKYHERRKTINHVLNTVYQDIFKGGFSTDNRNLLILSDREINHIEKTKIKQMRKEKNTPVFFIDVRKLTRLKNPHFFNSGTRSARLIFDKIPFVDVNLKSCNGKSSVYDECERLCKCKDNKMVDCYRVRREFSSMKKRNRIRYILTYKELVTNRRYRRTYLSYVEYHPKYFNKGIHERGQFFPWHRKYLLGFENLLRLVDCRVTIPYWNWAFYSDIAWSITPSYHMWNDESGFGGNGKLSNGYCVGTGYFNHRQWTMPDNKTQRVVILEVTCSVRNCCDEDDEECNDNFENKRDQQQLKKEAKCIKLSKTISQERKCLRRRFSSQTPSYHKVYNIIKNYKLNEFNKFESIVRDDWHNAIHNHVGGHMETDYSSEAPEFWLHHCVLDAFWDTWQKRGKEFAQDNVYSNMTELLGFVPKEDGKLYIHNHNLSGCGVKVLYHDVLPYHPRNVNNDVDDDDDDDDGIKKNGNCEVVSQFHSDEIEDAENDFERFHERNRNVLYFVPGENENDEWIFR